MIHLKTTHLFIAVVFSLTATAQDYKTMDSLTQMGFEYAKQGEYTKSNDCFRKVSKMYSMVGLDTLAFKSMEMIVKNRVDSLRGVALSYSKAQDYTKSNECYERAISELRSMDDSEILIAKVKNSIALNHIRMGHTLLKKKEYEEARHHYQTAVEYAIPESDAHKMALRGVGNTYSGQATKLRMEHHLSNANLQPALSFCLNAEYYYDLVSATELRLKEQVSRADLLANLNQAKEAIQLYLQILNECDGNESYNGIRGKASFGLGGIYRDQEQFKDAIDFLEQAYELCLVSNDKQNAYFAANYLAEIYKSQLPNSEKQTHWQSNADILKSELPSMEDYIQQIKQRRQKND